MLVNTADRAAIPGTDMLNAPAWLSTRICVVGEDEITTRAFECKSMRTNDKAHRDEGRVRLPGAGFGNHSLPSKPAVPAGVEVGPQSVSLSDRRAGQGQLVRSSHLNFVRGRQATVVIKMSKLLGIDAIARISDCGLNRNDSFYNVC